MRALIAEARSGVAGVFALLAFQPDWRQRFDVSAHGVARSFSGMALGLPALAFLVLSVNHYVAEQPSLPPEAALTVWEAALAWARMWLVFPVVAAIVAVLLDARAKFATWLVVHNWTVFALIHLQALLWAFYGAGIADARSQAAMIGVYTLLRLLIHWRVAAASLGLPFGLSVAAAGIPMIVDWMLSRLLV